MPKSPAPPSATGGAGTIFEYRLAAVVFGMLLRGMHAPVGFRLPIRSVGLQQSARGHTLDDIVIAAGPALQGPLVQIQVKKTIKITRSDRYLQEFLADAVAAVQNREDEFKDHGLRLGLATTAGLGSGSGDLEELGELASTAYEHCDSAVGFAAVLRPKVSSEALRKRYAHITRAMANAVPDLPAHEIDAMTHRVLASLHLWTVSIGPDGADERRILDELAPLLPDDATRATDVFSHLCDLAQECGKHGGVISAQALREKLFAKHGIRLLPAPAAITATDTAGTRSVCQLPPPAPHFQGRHDELEALRALSSVHAGTESVGGAFAAVVGRPGVGKTALALRLAHELRRDYGDAQLFADLQGVSDRAADPAEVLGRFLRSLGVGSIPEDLVERSALFRSTLADRRVLVVLDNAADHRQIEPLLPGAGPSLAIVTSRNKLVALHATRQLVLDALPDREAVELLCAAAGKPQLCEDPLAGEIAALCGRLPLALRIAGSALVSWGAWSTAELARSLRDETARLDRLSPDEEIGVRACIGLSYRRLPAATRRAFRLLAAVPAPGFTRTLATAALAAPERESARWLEALATASLIDRGQWDAEYRLHDLVYLYAHERLVEEESPSDIAEAEQRVLGPILGAVAHVDVLIRSSAAIGEAASTRVSLPVGASVKGASGALEWMDSHWPLIQGALGVAIKRQLDGELTRAVTRLDRYIQMRGLWTAWAGLAEDMAAIAKRRKDPGREIYAGLMALKAATWLRDAAACRLGISWLTRLLPRIDHPEVRADVLTMCGNAQREVLNELETALANFEAAYASYGEAGSEEGCAAAAHNVATGHREFGRYDEAIAWYELDLSHARRTGDLYDEARTLNSMGTALMGADRVDEAIDAQQRALSIFREFGDERFESCCLHDLGLALTRVGNHDEAIEHHQADARLCLKNGDKHGAAMALLHEGATLMYVDVARAAEVLEQAIAIAHEVAAADTEAEARGIRALAGVSRNEPGAGEALARAISALREHAAPRRVGLVHIAAAATRNQPREALISHARAALEIFTALGDRHDSEHAAALLSAWEESNDATVAEILSDVAILG